MRMLMLFQSQRTLQRIMNAAKPEQAWFTEHAGKRGGFMVTNVDSSCDIPRLAETLFPIFDAEESR